MTTATDPTRLPTARQTEIWNAVQRTGSQAKVAKQQGVTQAAIQSLLKGYMARMGIEGPMPGLVGAPVATEAAESSQEAPAPTSIDTSAPEPSEVEPERIPGTLETAAPEPDPEASNLESSRRPPSGPLGGLIFGLMGAASERRGLGSLHPMIHGSLVWLAEHASTWDGDERFRWTTAFGYALELAYPAVEPAVPAEPASPEGDPT